MIKYGKDLEDYVTSLCSFIQSSCEQIRDTTIRQCVESGYEIRISYPNGSFTEIKHPSVTPNRVLQLDIDPTQGVVDISRLSLFLDNRSRNLQAQVNKALEIVKDISDNEELVSKGYEPPFEIIP